MAHHHDRPRGTEPGERGGTRRALLIALVVNAGVLVAELVGGLAFGSLALLADAAHQLSDVTALSVSLIALVLVTRPGSARHTYGLRRAEALGAQINAVVLLVGAVVIFVEAVPRLGTPEGVDGAGVIVVAGAGLLVNLVSAVVLARTGDRSLNVRSAMVHLFADAAGSLAAIVAGIAVLAFDATWVDPLASILIGVLVVLASWRLLRETTNVLLEGTPRGLDVTEIESALAAAPGVTAVHHLHVWELGSDLPALSVHLVLDGEPTLHDAQGRAAELRGMLETRFGIEHATFELECHDCESVSDVVP